MERIVRAHVATEAVEHITVSADDATLLAGPPRLDGRWHNDLEPLAFRSLSQPGIERHKSERGRLLLGGADRGAELKGIRGAETMRAKEAIRRPSNAINRLDLLPSAYELIETFDRIRRA